MLAEIFNKFKVPLLKYFAAVLDPFLIDNLPVFSSDSCLLLDIGYSIILTSSVLITADLVSMLTHLSP